MPSHTLLFTMAIGLTLILPLVSSLSVADEPTVIKYPSRNNTPGLWDYQHELFELAMEHTRQQYGSYRIESNPRSLSAERGLLETEKGIITNVVYATSWSGQNLNINNVTCLDYPIMNGLMGFRSLLIREKDAALFSTIDSWSKFKKFKAGQGDDWIDTNIIESAGMKVVTATDINILPPMLARNRFDFYPLSILEAGVALEEIKKKTSGLSIAKNLYIFYPLSMQMCITKKEPLLTERLTKGIELADQDGSIQKLFDKHFNFIKKIIEGKQNTVFFIESPFVSAEKNKQVLQAFTKKYGEYVVLIKQENTQ